MAWIAGILPFTAEAVAGITRRSHRLSCSLCRMSIHAMSPRPTTSSGDDSHKTPARMAAAPSGLWTPAPPA